MGNVSHDRISILNRFITYWFRPGKPAPIRRLVSLFFHVELPISNVLVRLPHPYAVVVNPAARLGSNVTLYQGVTVGGKRMGRMKGTPTLEDDVVMFPNSVVIGNVVIGRGAQIGPGAVVHFDVPPGGVVIGNPGRILELKEAV